MSDFSSIFASDSADNVDHLPAPAAAGPGDSTEAPYVELRGGGLEPAVGKGEVGKDAPIEPITEPLLRSPNPQDFAAELDITFRPPSGSSEGLRSDESFKQISPRDLPGGSTHGDIEACPSIDRAMSPESMQLLDEALRETTHSQAAPEREQTDGTLSAGAQPAEASLHISSLGGDNEVDSAPNLPSTVPDMLAEGGRDPYPELPHTRDTAEAAPASVRMSMYLNRLNTLVEQDRELNKEMEPTEMAKKAATTRPPTRMEALIKVVRDRARMVVQHTTFNTVVFLVVLFNSLYMVWELDNEVGRTDGLYINGFFTLVFFVEAVLKIVAHGFYKHRKAYWRDPWNRLDFVVLLAGMLSLLVEVFHADTKLQLMVILRFIRVGRAIRTFGRVPSLRTVVGVLFRTVHQLRVSFLFIIVLFIFSCIGEQLFHGKLRLDCVQKDFLPLGFEKMGHGELLNKLGNDRVKGLWTLWLQRSGLKPCRKVGDSCDDAGSFVCVELLNPGNGFLDFDSFTHALLTCITIITGEGWAAIMYDMKNHGKSLHVLYFFALMFAGWFLCLNMLLAAIRQVFSAAVTNQLKNQQELRNNLNKRKMFDNMRKAKMRKRTGTLPGVGDDGEILEQKGMSWSVLIGQFLSKLKKDYLAAQDRFLERPAVAVVVVSARRIVTHWAFDVVAMGCTLLNTGVLAYYHHNIRQSSFQILEGINEALLIWFWVETILKVLAFNKHFHKDKFDVFDLAVNVVTTTSAYMDGSSSVTALRSVRQVKIVRLFRAVRYSEAIRSLKALRTSTYLLSSLLSLLWFTLFVYAIIGMVLFKEKYESYDKAVMITMEEYSTTMFCYGPVLRKETCTSELGKLGIKDTEAVNSIIEECKKGESEGAVEPTCSLTIWEQWESNAKRVDPEVVMAPAEAIELLSPRAGFRTFVEAIVTLFQAITLEGWTFIMYDAMKLSTYPVVGAVFYVSWVLIAVYFLLSLMVTIILDNFEREYQENKKRTAKKKREREISEGGPDGSTTPARGSSRVVAETHEQSSQEAIRFSEMPQLMEAISATPTEAQMLELKTRLKIVNDEQFLDVALLLEILPELKITNADTADTMQELFSMWVYYDQDNSGKLEVKEVLNLLEQLSTQSGDDERSQMLVADLQYQLQAYQADDVQFYEFLSLFFDLAKDPTKGSLQKLLQPEQVAWLSTKFKEADYDNSGFISVMEFKDFLTTVGVEVNDWEMQIMVTEMDTDGDEHICFSEFLRGILNYFGEMGSNGVATTAFKENLQNIRADEGDMESDDSMRTLSQQRSGIGRLVQSASMVEKPDQHTNPGDGPPQQPQQTEAAKPTWGGKRKSGGVVPTAQDEGLKVLAEKNSKWAYGIAFTSNTQSTSREHERMTFQKMEREFEMARRNAMGNSDGKGVLTKVKSMRKSVTLDRDLQNRLNEEMDLEKKELTSSSFFIFGPDNPARLFVKDHIVETPQFQWTIFILIIASCIMMGFENPQWEVEPKWFQYTELGFAVAFLLEILLKCFVYGVVYGEGTYLRNYWNILDATVVLSSILTMVTNQFDTGGEKLSWMQSFRLIRALRPLRAIAQARGGRSSLTALLLAMPSLLSVLAASSLLMFLFSILAVDLYAGGFYHCMSGGFYAMDQANAVREWTDPQTNITSDVNLLEEFKKKLKVKDLEPQYLPTIMMGVCLRFNYTWTPDVGCWDPTMSGPDHREYSEEGIHLWSPTKMSEDEMKKEKMLWIPLAATDHITQLECTAAGHRWINQMINFDNVFHAMIACFVSMTGEGWVELMNSAMDGTGAERESSSYLVEDFTKNTMLKRESDGGYYHSHTAAFFFVVYMHLFAFFLLDVYAGAVYSFYQQVKLKDEGKLGMTTSQRQWWDMQKLLIKTLHTMPRPKGGAMSLGGSKQGLWNYVRRFRESTVFATLNVAVILLAAIIAMMRHHEEGASLRYAAEVIEVIVIVWASIEVITRVNYLGSAEYFRDHWNRVDATVLVIVIVTNIFRWASSMDNAMGLYILRLVRIGWILGQFCYGDKSSRIKALLRQYIIQHIERAQVIFESFIESLSGLLDLVILIMVLIYIFSIVGMNLFGSLDTDLMENYNQDANFSNILTSVVTLLRVITGEDWQTLFVDMVWLSCDENDRLVQPDRCTKTSPIMFFVFYYLVVVVMITSLIVTVIIDIFQEIVEREYSTMGMAHIRTWMQEWKAICHFTEEGDSYLLPTEFMSFLKLIDQPLGVGIHSDDVAVLHRVRALKLDVKDGRIYLEDALFAASFRVACLSNPCFGQIKNASNMMTASYGNAFLKSLRTFKMDPLKEGEESRQEDEEETPRFMDLGAETTASPPRTEQNSIHSTDVSPAGEAPTTKSEMVI